MAQNPFYIEPASGLSGFKALQEGIGSRIEYERGKAEEAQKMKKRQEAGEVINRGDPKEVSQFMIENSDIAAEMRATMKHKDELTEQNYKESLERIIIGDELPSKVGVERSEFVDNRGGDATESMQFTAEAQAEQEATGSQEQAKKRAELIYSMHFPKEWEALNKARGVEKPTTDIKDFQYYQTLLKENPEQAELFAQQVGIKTKTDDRTNAIKEFEYGVKNPDFALAQKQKADKKATKKVKDTTFKDSSDLRKEFLSQSKEYQKVRDSYTRVVGSTQDPSPAGDLSLIFNYMKMLDPGSVVRESEFATAASTGSYGQRIQASVQKVLSGERLAPEMRADFVKKAGVLFNGMQKQHTKREKNYTGIAERNKLPVEEVVVDITTPVEEEPQYREGQTATGPNGEKLIFRNGQWETM
jgi:hypothetical protein